MRMKTFVTSTLVILALGSLSLTLASAQSRGDRFRRGGSYRTSALVNSGTQINVRLNTAISTDNTTGGDTWTGTVDQDVYSGNRMTIPAGSPVTGTVTSTQQGTHSTKAQMSLAVRDVTVNGRSYAMNAYTAPIVAGTGRAKKLGAIAIGAGAGALVGHTVAKGNHGTLIGGLLGGAAGYGLTRHAFRTLQLKPGTVVGFTTRENVMARR